MLVEELDSPKLEFDESTGVSNDSQNSNYLLLPSAESEARKEEFENDFAYNDGWNVPKTDSAILKTHTESLHSRVENDLKLSLYEKLLMLYPTLVTSETIRNLQPIHNEDSKLIKYLKTNVNQREELVDASGQLALKALKIDINLKEINEIIKQLEEEKKLKQEELIAILDEKQKIASIIDKIDRDIIRIRDESINKFISVHSSVSIPLDNSSNPDLRPFENSNVDILEAHSDKITCIDFNIENGIVVSGSVDKHIKVWSLENNQCLSNLSGHSDVVKTLQISDYLIVSGSNDRTIRIWSLPDPYNLPDFNVPPKPLLVLRGHTGKVTSVMFDNNWILSGSYDGTIRQWDLHTGKLISVLGSPAPPQLSSFHSVWSSLPDISYPLKQTHTPSSPVNSIQFCGPALASAHDDGIVRLWDVRSSLCNDSLFGHLGPVHTLKLDHLSIVTGGSDGTVRSWDIRKKDQTSIFELSYAVFNISIDPSSIIAAIKHLDVMLCNRINGVAKPMHFNSTTQYALKHIEDTLVSGGLDGNILICKL